MSFCIGCVFETPFLSHLSHFSRPSSPNLFAASWNPSFTRGTTGVGGDEAMKPHREVAPNLSLMPWVPLYNTSWPTPIIDPNSNLCLSSRARPPFFSHSWTPLIPLSRTLNHHPQPSLSFPYPEVNTLPQEARSFFVKEIQIKWCRQTIYIQIGMFPVMASSSTHTSL